METRARAKVKIRPSNGRRYPPPFSNLTISNRHERFAQMALANRGQNRQAWYGALPSSGINVALAYSLPRALDNPGAAILQ
jgi:hypothetical protein